MALSGCQFPQEALDVAAGIAAVHLRRVRDDARAHANGAFAT